MIFALAFRNVFRGRARFILGTFIVAVASYLLVYATGQISGVRNTLRNSMADTLTGHIQIKPRAAPRDFFDFSTPRSMQTIGEADLQSMLAALKRLPSVRAAAPRIRFGTLIGNEERSVPALVLAVDPAQERLVSPDLAGILAPLSDPGAALTSPILMKKSGVAQGGETLAFTDTADESFNARPFVIAGTASAPVLIDEFMNALFVVNLSSARRLLEMDGGATDIVVRVTPEAQGRIQQVAAEIEAALTPAQRAAFGAYPFWDVARSVGNIAGIAAGVATLQVGTVMLVMLVIVLIVTRMSLHERRFEIGTLMSIGMTRGRLASMFATEVAIKVAIGYGVGLVLALATLALVREHGGVRAASGVDQYLYGGKVMFPVLDAASVALGFALVVGAAVLTTIATCWKAGAQDVVALLASRK